MTTRRERTDLGNAYRLVDRHGHQLVYVHTWNKALVYDGTRWKVDDTDQVTRWAIDTVHALRDEAATAPTDAARAAARKHAARAQQHARIRAMVALARSHHRIAISHHHLDPDPWLLNVANGTIDLTTGRLRPHDPADRCTRLAPVAYDPDASAPTWTAFLDQVLVDPDTIAFLQRLVGYALTGVVRDHVLPMLVGDGSNGKSTLTGMLLAMLGDYAITSRSELLLTTRNDQHPTLLADLHGRRLVVISETGQGRNLNEDQVKTLTGGDRLRARRMREDFWEYSPSHKLLLVTNHLPDIRGRDHGIWRRIKRIDFPTTITDANSDTALPERLRAELPGILAWAVRGCLDWQRHGLATPAAVRDGVEAYREATDVIGPFLAEHCRLADGLHVASADLYAAYRTWCQQAGEQPASQKLLAQHLTRRGLTNRKFGKARQVHWFGIALDNDEQAPWLAGIA
jgi:putative DNA primase/helicase